MIIAWTGTHGGFVVEMFKTSESEITAQRFFLAHFMLCWNDAVLDRKSILLWVKSF